MLSQLQKSTAQAIVNIFETDAILGNYSTVTVLPGDTGHLTYGKAQTTLSSGNLHRLIERYCHTANARYAAALHSYLPDLKNKNIELDHDQHLHNLLAACADDPIMVETQDTFFDEVYWQLAEKRAQRQNLQTALGMAIVYDSTIHGSWDYMRHRTNRERGTIELLDEKNWLNAYIHTRLNWLANHRRSILRRTTYRMHTFIDMIMEDYWDLPLPMVIRHHEISAETLNATPKGSFTGPEVGSRALTLSSPLLRGLDVRALQLALSALGYALKADGWFGRGTMRHLQQYQIDNNLSVDGQLNTDDLIGLINATQS